LVDGQYGAKNAFALIVIRDVVEDDVLRALAWFI
jgi:hypothetical protein